MLELELTFNLDDINYDKIIIMTDAEIDGAHILHLCFLLSSITYASTSGSRTRLYRSLPLYKMSKGKGKKEVVELLGRMGNLKNCQKFGRGATLQLQGAW